jgi:hypothetical protein
VNITPKKGWKKKGTSEYKVASVSLVLSAPEMRVDYCCIQAVIGRPDDAEGVKRGGEGG